MHVLHYTPSTTMILHNLEKRMQPMTKQDKRRTLIKDYNL